jgi:SAM-dependent methyltransferase
MNGIDQKANAPMPGLAAATVATEIWNPDLVSTIGWRGLRDGTKDVAAAAPIDYLRFLREEHHHFYGRPWCIGRTYFDFLRGLGLRPGASVLDFGCGAGRLGIWLIDYLDAGHYVGVDHHWEAISAFASYEIPLHDLAGKQPRLILDGSLDVVRIGQAFDLILDCFVSFHLDEQDRSQLYRGFARVLAPDGSIVLPHAATLDHERLAELGLAVVDDQVIESGFLVGHLPEAKARDHWHVIRRV